MRSLLTLDLTFTTGDAIAADAIAADATIVRADTASLAGDALRRLCPTTRTFVDLGPLSALAYDMDLAAAARAPIDGVALPGCRGGADVQHLAAKLAVTEAENGLAEGTLGIIAAVAGTAGAVLDLRSLAAASRRLRAIVFDAENLGALLAPGGQPFAMARALTIVAAAAAGVPAYDMLLTPDIEACCQAAERDGFAGLLTSRTDAIVPINRHFAKRASPATDA